MTLSVHTTRYQKDSCVLPDGTVKVCATLLSPLNGLALPTRAVYAPECGDVTAAAAPVAVQPLSVPVSKPPLTIGSSLGGGGGGGGGGGAPEPVYAPAQVR